MPPPLHPNQQLLLTSSRVACETGDPAELRTRLGSTVDWPDLLRRASDEGLAGLLYEQLHRMDLDAALPQSVSGPLRRIYLAQLLDHQQKVKAVEQLDDAFGREGLRFLLMQGMTIIDRVYTPPGPSPGARPLSDVDLLIAPDDLPRAQQLLERLGYAALHRYPPTYARQGVCIDLHHELTYLSRVEPRLNPLRVDDGPIWRTAAPWRTGSNAACVAATADQIILASAHLQKHSFGRLIWFVDIGRLIRAHARDAGTTSLPERARELGLEKPLHFVSSYLQKVIGMATEPSTAGWSPQLDRSERRLLSLLLDNRRIDGMGDWLYLQAVPAATRWRFLVRIAFPAREVIRDEMGSESGGTIVRGYAARLGRLAGRGLRLAARLLTARPGE